MVEINIILFCLLGIFAGYGAHAFCDDVIKYYKNKGGERCDM